MLKRWISILLSLLMVISMLPMPVLATETEEEDKTLWSGKTAVFVGDSITAGSGTSKVYYEYLEETFGFGSVTAMGIGGSCVSAASDYGTNNTPLINRYQNIPSADLILIFMGTNDYGHETPLGTPEDTQDGTFYGALNTIIPALVAKHPSSKIVFATPLHRYGFGTSQILGTAFTYDTIPNGAGATLGDYVDALKAVCADHDVSVIDLYAECTLDPSDVAVRAAYMPDGLHPNADGHAVIAEIMASHIRTYVPAETTPEAETELVYGNKFAAGYEQTNRASSRLNLYLKAGTTITLHDPAVFQWACARTTDETACTNLGYFPDSGWTDKETAVVETDGWVGFVFKYRDETQVFDLTRPLSDYITIEEPHTHTYENGTCTGCGATTSPYLQQLPEQITGCSNLYDLLTPTKGYYTASKYDTSNGAVLSVVIPVEPGDRIAASSFGPVAENMGSCDGIRVTYLMDGTIVESMSADNVYTAYTQDGYLTVPEGVNMVSVPWWKPSDSNWLTLSQISRNFAAHSPVEVSAQTPTCTESGYTAGEICEICNASLGAREEIPATGHTYRGNTCTACGAVNLKSILEGKYVSILGDSISTFNGYSNDASVNSTIGGNAPRYDAGTADTKPGSYCLLESVNDTWWMHFANRSGMELLVNNSWAGSQVFGGQTSDGRVIPAAYLDRCVNLHDNTLDNNPGNAPIHPDVIFVYLGINDYNFNRSNVGSGTVDYAKLMGSDGTYVTPATFGEAYGILLHKMQQAYPDAQIFAMTLLPEDLYSVNVAAWEQHNAYIRAAAETYDIPVVDLAGKCAITWENYSGYMMDKIHPTTAGMELISDCIEAELAAYYKENPPHTHAYESVVTPPTCTEQGYTTYTCAACGDSYKADFVEPVWHSYDDGQCSMCGDEMLRISLNELVRYQGGVNSLDGTLNTTFTNNWYSDIRIPEGAEQVRFLMFKTGGNWGSAFLKGSTYLSGICDKTVGGYWKTLDVPEEATTLRYGYLYDEIATNAGYPTFAYLEFVGEDLTVQEDSGFMDRPATGCHSFSVKVNIAPAQGNPTGYAEGTDYGYIQLPTNYTSYGEPTRLIIVCHGAGANLATYQSNAWKTTNYSFWTDLGYAVMDMYASPAELTGNNSELHYGSPIVVDCYKEGYDYVMEHFNLKQDGVFLIGSSMGGLSSFQIAQSGEFPVIAQVGYCPAIDLFKQAYVNPWTTASYQRSKIAAYFDFDGTAPAFTDSRYPSAAEIAYYKNNFDKTIPYSPILSNVVSGDLEKIFDVIPSSATASSAEEEALYQQLTATHPNPLMIFHNTDDGTVAYRYSKYFVDMVNRSGQEAVLRTFTSGAHNAWANGNDHTVQGINGNITIKDSQYEAYLFFQKYEEHAEHIGWTDPAVAPTCTESGLTEGSHCAVCGEVIVAQEAVPATGVHTYENGVCTGCGEAEVLQGSIRLRSATLNLLDKVCIIYKASDDLVPTKDADVAERGVLLYDSAEKAASKDPALAYETVQLTYDPAEGRYVGQTEGIDARDMDKSQFAVAHLKLRDGTYVFATREGVDQVQEYSPLIYCRNKAADPVVGKLCRAMMHYGAAAQVLQYGMTTGLMNEDFEEIPYDASVLGTEVFSVDTTVINGMRLRSATMDLQGAISYIVKYEMTEETAGKALYAEYTLLGQQGSMELEYHAEENRWWATISGVPAKDLGAVLTVKPYWLDGNGAKMYGGELVYSGNEYVRRTLNKADNPASLQALARAMAMYVHYADEYGN